MAITAAERREIAEIIVLMFDAAPGATYLAQLISAYQAVGNNLNTLTDIIAAHPAYASVHTVIDTDEEWTDDLLATVGLQGDFQAESRILNALNDGVSKGDITYGLYTFLNDVAADANAAVNYGPQYISAAEILENKAEVAIYYSVTVANPSTNLAELMDVVENVDASQSSVDDAIDAINGETGAQVINLTDTLDVLNGTSADDLFVGRVVQNSLGEQVNQLGSGDQIDGGNGMDMLTAKITAGAFVGGSSTMPIEPETDSVEVIKLQAANSDIGEGNTEVFVNAKDMADVQQLWSNRSDANLTIQNMTTIGLESLSDMTIGMAYTGNADSSWDESDYTVYFDQDYLTPETTRTRPIVDFLAMNEDNYDLDPTRPLDGVFFRQLQFRVNGEVFDLVPFLDEDKSLGGTGSEIVNYDEFLAAVQNALVELKQATAANRANEALQTVDANLGRVFTTDANPDTLILREGTSIRLSVAGLTNGVQNTINVESTDLEVARAVSATVPNNNRYELAEEVDASEGEVLAINVALEKVGLAGDGGELIIGSMNKTTDNEWDAVNTVTDTTSGIEQFDVIVYGNNDKSSSLSGLHSTNNNLRVVTVTTDLAQMGGSYADLTIGNSNTEGFDEIEVDFEQGGPFFSTVADDLDEVNTFSSYGFDEFGDPEDEDFVSIQEFYDYGQYDQALKDVQTFNASAFQGDLTLYAALTAEVVDKYLDLQDDADPEHNVLDAPELDNVGFVYTGGTGNDDFNLTLSAANLAAGGTTTREDFTLSINGADGDDEITLAIIDSEGNGNSQYDAEDEQGLAIGDGNNGPFNPINGGGFANWYDNNAINENLNIFGGDGNDTIRTPGSGDVNIDGGDGLDTVYADNTGDMAIWAFNVRPDGSDSRYMVDNLQSDFNDSYNLFDTDVVVDFMGFESQFAITSNRGVVTDLDINQAIKRAINLDPVLSKLLLATDGPANTLIISSLIDGEFGGQRLDDLTISLEGPTAGELTAGEVNQLIGFYGSDAAGLTTPADFVGFFEDVIEGIDGFEDNGDYETNFGRDNDGGDGDEINGSDSIHVSDNEITGGLGNDVMVLGTGTYSNDAVVYEGFANGTDTIVYFDTDFLPATTGYNSTSFETVQLRFTGSDGNPAAQTITFDGVTVNLAAPTLQGVIPALDVASQFVNQYNAAAATNNWVATLNGAGPAVLATTEVATMTATETDLDLTAGQTYTVAGLTYTSTGVTTQAQLADAFANLLNGAVTGAGIATGTYSGTLTGYSTGPVGFPAGGVFTVQFTSATPGQVTDLTDSGTGAAAAAIAVTTQGTDATDTRFVTLTRDVPGAVTDLTAADFTGNYFASAPDPDGQGVVTVAVSNQGADNIVTAATASTYTVTYTTANTAVTASGASVTRPANADQGDGALTLANDAQAAPPAGYTAGAVIPGANGSSYSVKFTASTPGAATALPTDADYGLDAASTTDGINGSFTGTLGTNAVTAPPVLVTIPAQPGPGIDYLDFSSYDAVAVYVDGDLIAGNDPTAGQSYITLVSQPEDGVYLMTEKLEVAPLGTAGDTTVGIIGTADFGMDMVFIEENFIL
ncbi:MAG: hypothetical protein Q8R63_05730 [Ramlibacter sp.]|nr:hypothetical protein [Ramlibacter sp.]